MYLLKKFSLYIFLPFILFSIAVTFYNFVLLKNYSGEELVHSYSGLIYYIVTFFITALFLFKHYPRSEDKQLLSLKPILVLIYGSILYLAFITLNITSTSIGMELFTHGITTLIASALLLLTIDFAYNFTKGERISTWSRLIQLVLIMPMIILLSTDLRVETLQFANFLTYYFLILTGIIIFWITLIFTKTKKLSKPETKKEVLGLNLASVLFVLLLSFSELASGDGSAINLKYILFFSSNILLITLALIAFKTKPLFIKIFLFQSLILSFLFFSVIELFYNNSVPDALMNTLLLFMVLGLFYYTQNEQSTNRKMSTLTSSLKKANSRIQKLDKLKSEFVSIASYQLRSPLTSIRGYASLLLEGSYGKITKKMIEPLERIEVSSKLMALAIEDYLNVSIIESGNMKYKKADFNLKNEVDYLCDDIRSEAFRNGLSLIFRSDLKSRGVVNADLGKTIQILRNLINNSLKYTEKGSIRVFVRDDVTNKKISVDITDTGIGMSKKTQETIFEKFERADNANTVNVQGTGLGLFVALKMAKAMRGDITSFSEGEGKGSRFTLELPLAM